MNEKLSRRKLITRGLGAAAGLSGLAVATRLAARYGLIPPDWAGLYGAGTTLTYAAQRVVTRHSLAREFPKTMISKAPFANGKPLETEAFKTLQAGGFAGWRLEVNGMVAHPGAFSMSDLRGLPVRSQITQVTCEEGWCPADGDGQPQDVRQRRRLSGSRIRLFLVRGRVSASGQPNQRSHEIH